MVLLDRGTISLSAKVLKDKEVLVEVSDTGTVPLPPRTCSLGPQHRNLCSWPRSRSDRAGG
eukprot:3004470-Rhodomonas_salina.6